MSIKGDKEQHKRDLIAIGSALLIHILIAGGFIISHFVLFNDVEEYRGPVLVKLGRADAPDEVTDKQPALPANGENKEIVSENNDPEKTEEIKSGDPVESVKIDETDSQKAVDSVVSEKETGDLGDSDTSAEKTSESSNSATENVSEIEAEEIISITKGSEEGNAYETTYEASPGLVGRNWWIPIYMYMPLPQYIKKNVINSVKGDDEIADKPGSRTAEYKKDFLKNYYKLIGDEYYLYNIPAKEERPQIWSILEDGNYNIKNAEYKKGRNLRDVTITFTISAVENEAMIEDAQINRSSGYGEIDEAVLYGFLKASFYNSAEKKCKRALYLSF